MEGDRERQVSHKLCLHDSFSINQIWVSDLEQVSVVSSIPCVLLKKKIQTEESTDLCCYSGGLTSCLIEYLYFLSTE